MTALTMVRFTAPSPPRMPATDCPVAGVEIVGETPGLRPGLLRADTLAAPGQEATASAWHGTSLRRGYHVPGCAVMLEVAGCRRSRLRSAVGTSAAFRLGPLLLHALHGKVVRLVGIP
jgi:hypothetical protein